MQAAVGAAGFEQLRMPALFDDRGVVDDDDAVGVLERCPAGARWFSPCQIVSLAGEQTAAHGVTVAVATDGLDIHVL